MSILLKSRNHFNFSAANKCGFLFKQIIFEYLFKQSELIGYKKTYEYCEHYEWTERYYEWTDEYYEWTNEYCKWSNEWTDKYYEWKS